MLQCEKKIVRLILRIQDLTHLANHFFSFRRDADSVINNSLTSYATDLEEKVNKKLEKSSKKMKYNRHTINT